MQTMHRNIFIAILVLFGIFMSAWATASENARPEPLIIQEQGSFAVGGTVVTNPGTFDPVRMSPEGQTFHGDHAYAFYQIPAKARKFPLVLWHGYGQFSKTWETTPDGREGYQNIFRVGIWPNLFQGVQFSREPETLNQYFRQMTTDTGPFDIEVVSNAVAALFNKIGPGVHVTHSHSGGQQAMDSRPENIRQSAEGSLKRLFVEAIDIYYQHRVDPEVPIEDVAGAVKGRSNTSAFLNRSRIRQNWVHENRRWV